MIYTKISLYSPRKIGTIIRKGGVERVGIWFAYDPAGNGILEDGDGKVLDPYSPTSLEDAVNAAKRIWSDIGWDLKLEEGL